MPVLIHGIHLRVQARRLNDDARHAVRVWKLGLGKVARENEKKTRGRTNVGGGATVLKVSIALGTDMTGNTD